MGVTSRQSQDYRRATNMIVGYVLKRREDGKYVAPPGRDKSYTTDLANARLYASQEEAEADACGNEFVSPVKAGE